MNDEELVQAATEYAQQQHNRNPDDYSVSSVTREDDKVRINFLGKNGPPGDHFSVLLDSDTGEVIRYILGR